MRYHGGKFLIAKSIINEFPFHETYVELYGGGGSIMLCKQPAILDVYNDLSSEICDVFRVLRDPELSIQLKEKLYYSPYSREEWLESFDIDDNMDIVERVRRTLIRSWQTIGTYNFNSKRKSGGWRGVAFKRDFHPIIDFLKWQSLIDAFVERLRCVVLENQPALKVADRYDSIDTLFYADPPYLARNRRHGKADAYEYEMTDSDHVELIEKLLSLEGMVILSGYSNEIYNDMLLPKNWTTKIFKGQADGVPSGTNKLYREEVIWINPQAKDRKKILTLF